MAEPDPSARRSRIAKCFRELPLRDDKELLIILTGVWRIAVAKPNDPEFPALGLFPCMAKLINCRTNMSIPYYAAHIIGSYTMNTSEFAEMAVRAGVLTPLMELLRGKMSWVEQRVAVRALGHIASHRATFKAVAAHELEIVKLAMKIACTCIETVYNEFVKMGSEGRMEYQCELMGKGVGGLELQNKKAEAWATQLQCWSLYLLNCFARKKRSINLICNQEFLTQLCSIWGGLENQNSFSGIGLIRTLCLTQNGRENIANSPHLLKTLCNLSRSSDHSQIKSIKILLSLLQDPNTRHKTLQISAPFLVDLVELRANRARSKLGNQIAELLLQDYAKTKVGRRKRDELMSGRELKQRRVMVSLLKKEGNQKFWAGKVAEAAVIYKKALDLCPLKLRKERIVLHSNRAQCFLIQGEAESAISDTTRALCLSGQANPHLKSLWRRSQAFDMKGMGRESLMDCMAFINACSKAKGRRGMKIPYYAIRMLNKQMNATKGYGGGLASRKTRDWIAGAL
nr:Tetratricopeptide repeat protein 1 [Ipomoea batatas]